MSAVTSTPRRARSKSVSDAAVAGAAAALRRSIEQNESTLFPSPSVGHFASLGTVLSGDEEDDQNAPSTSSTENQEQGGEARPLLPLHELNPTSSEEAPLFPFDHFGDSSASTPVHSRSRNNSNVSSELNQDQCLLPMGGDDAPAVSSLQQPPVFTQRQRSRRRLLLQQQQQQQRSSTSASASASGPSSTVSSSSARASSESAPAATAVAPNDKAMGTSLRASLDAGMLAVRNWIRSHQREHRAGTGARRPVSAFSSGNADELDDSNNIGEDDTDDDLFPTIFEADEPSPQASPQNDSVSQQWRRGGPLDRGQTARQRTRSEPDSAGLHEYFLHSSVRRRRRRASTVDERTRFDPADDGGTNLFGNAPNETSLLATPPRRRAAPHLAAAAQARLSSSAGERLSSSAAAALSWNSATPTRNPFDHSSDRVSSGGPANARQRQPSLDAQQMLLLLTPTPSTDDHPLMNDDIDLMLSSDTFDAETNEFSLEPASSFPYGAAPPLADPFTQASSRSVSGTSGPLHESQQPPFGVDETTRPEASPAEVRDREARLRWIRINRRFQIVITTVALIFSVVLFAILLCWVVLTSTYVVSLDKPCDVNLKAYFWLVTLQLVLDVFRSDILRFVFRWDSNSSDRIPCRVIAYNMVYLLYALMVLRLGITSVYVGSPTCKSTAPELFKASTAFVSLSLAAWGIILFGYVVPLFVVAALLTYNGYNPTDARDARPTGSGPTPVFPAAYSMNGAPPGCIEQLERVGIDEVRGQDCCICMEDFDKDDVVVRTACSHCFHKQCCREWLRQARTCPVCRADIPSALAVPGADGRNTESQTYSEGLSAGEQPSRIPLGPTGRPVRGLFMRVFRRTDSDTVSPPQSSSSNTSSRAGGAGGGSVGRGGAGDLEMGIASAASPRARY